MNDEPEFEELEQIPWSALAARTPPPLLRPLTVAAVVAVVIAVVGWLALRATSPDPFEADPGPVATSPPVAATSAETAPTAAAASAAETLGTPPGAVGASIYSEADLMAISVADEARLAATYGEWFVQDYFTIDGDDEITNSLGELVDGDAILPHRDPVGSSYVEWARAVAVASPRPADYLVDVAFRTLFSTEADIFTRAPVRAVTVAVSVDVDGTATIVGLPTPVELPTVAWEPNITGAVAVAPDAIAADAVETAKSFGPEPLVIEATRAGSTWHFVMDVGDGSGNRWPLAVSVVDP